MDTHPARCTPFLAPQTPTYHRKPPSAPYGHMRRFGGCPFLAVVLGRLVDTRLAHSLPSDVAVAVGAVGAVTAGRSCCWPNFFAFGHFRLTRSQPSSPTSPSSEGCRRWLMPDVLGMMGAKFEVLEAAGGNRSCTQLQRPPAAAECTAKSPQNLPRFLRLI
jgi:hypothetical protein